MDFEWQGQRRWPNIDLHGPKVSISLLKLLALYTANTSWEQNIDHLQNITLGSDLILRMLQEKERGGQRERESSGPVPFEDIQILHCPFFNWEKSFALSLAGADHGNSGLSSSRCPMQNTWWLYSAPHGQNDAGTSKCDSFTTCRSWLQNGLACPQPPWRCPIWNTWRSWSWRRTPSTCWTTACSSRSRTCTT